MVFVSMLGYCHRRRVWAVHYDERAMLTPVTRPLGHGILLRVSVSSLVKDVKLSLKACYPRVLWARV